MVDYSNEALIANIKRRCLVPTSQITFENESFVLLANDQLQGQVVTDIMSTREQYFLTDIDVTPDVDGIITIPADAIGVKLRSVNVIQPGTNNNFMYSLPCLDLDVVSGYTTGSGTFGNFGTIGGYGGYYIEGNDIHLYPNNLLNNSSQQIRLYYFKRSLVLAAPADYGKIISIDYDNNSVVLNNVPLDWTTGTEINIVSASPPGFKAVTPFDTIVSVSSPTVNLTDVSKASVGDYVSIYGYSAIPQIPVEAHAYLAQLTAAKCLESLGDRDGMQAALSTAETLLKGIMIVTQPRVDGSPKKIINPNGGIAAASGLGQWGRGWGNR